MWSKQLSFFSRLLRDDSPVIPCSAVWYFYDSNFPSFSVPFTLSIFFLFRLDLPRATDTPKTDALKKSLVAKGFAPVVYVSGIRNLAADVEFSKSIYLVFLVFL